MEYGVMIMADIVTLTKKTKKQYRVRRLMHLL